jgi:hypothetical protein
MGDWSPGFTFDRFVQRLLLNRELPELVLAQIVILQSRHQPLRFERFGDLRGAE